MRKLKKIKCRHCGSSVEPYVERQKYCSKRCRDSARSKRIQASRPKKLTQRTCEVCSSAYQPKNAGQKYCTPACWTIIKKKREQEAKPEKPPKCCPICTGFFAPKSRGHKFCSDACRDQAAKNAAELRKQRRRASALPNDESDWQPPKVREIRRRRCVVCEDFFRPKASQQKTCSTSCRNEHRANVNRRCAKDKKEERALAAEAFELLTARLERKKEIRDEINGETNYSAEIEAFLAKGGKVQVYPVIWSPDVFNSMPEEIF